MSEMEVWAIAMAVVGLFPPILAMIPVIRAYSRARWRDYHDMKLIGQTSLSLHDLTPNEESDLYQPVKVLRRRQSQTLSGGVGI